MVSVGNFFEDYPDQQTYKEGCRKERQRRRDNSKNAEDNRVVMPMGII